MPVRRKQKIPTNEALAPDHHCRHPSIRTLGERFSPVQVGCSRFSRCCHLLGDLSSCTKLEVGPGDRRSHRNSALGFGSTSLKLCTLLELGGCQHRRTAVVERLVPLSTYPQPMQRHRQFASGGDDGSLLSTLAATLSQPQSPSSQIAVSPKLPEDVLRPLHQQRSQIGIALFTARKIKDFRDRNSKKPAYLLASVNSGPVFLQYVPVVSGRCGGTERLFVCRCVRPS